MPSPRSHQAETFLFTMPNSTDTRIYEIKEVLLYTSKERPDMRTQRSHARANAARQCFARRTRRLGLRTRSRKPFGIALQMVRMVRAH